MSIRFHSLAVVLWISIAAIGVDLIFNKKNVDLGRSRWNSGGRMASAQGGVWGGVSSPRPIIGYGECRDLPQRDPGSGARRKRILAYFEGHRTLLFVPICWSLSNLVLEILKHDKIWGEQFALASHSKFWGILGGDLSRRPHVIYAHGCTVIVVTIIKAAPSTCHVI